MNWLKKILIAILSLILTNCICLLALSFNIQSFLVDGVMKEIIIKKIKSTKEANIIITEESINKITEDENIREILNSPEIKDLMNKYFEKTIDGLIDENSIDEVKIEKDIINYLKDNKNVLEDLTNQEITDQMIDETIKQIDDGDITNAWKQTVTNTSKNMPKVEKQVLKSFKVFTSTLLRVILFSISMISILLIAILQKSLIKWIFTLCLSVLLSGILITIINTFVTIIIKAVSNFSILYINSFLQTGLVMIIIGLLGIVIYKIIEKNKEIKYEN